MHLVQLTRAGRRAAALVEDDRLHLLTGFSSVYELAMYAIRGNEPIGQLARQALSGESIDYAPVHAGRSEWRLLCPVDHPADPARVMVSGTGLTHKVSAENRAAMHQDPTTTITDSMRMYRLGKEGGKPAPGRIGVQPEWFYKGNGSILRAHLEPLEVPAYAMDGGEEAEIAGAYVIGEDGRPYRIGFMIGNEFSDHVTERENYLYLAHSKLRTCSVGPELVVADEAAFQDIIGAVSVQRRGQVHWQANFYSGQKNMCHALVNLEHHHFKYEAHRRAGDVHVHFFGADAFSFGEGIRLQDGDMVEIGAPGFGRTLRNPIVIAGQEEQPMQVASLTP
jgi:hypothetical protein